MTWGQLVELPTEFVYPITQDGQLVATQPWATSQFSTSGHNHDAAYSGIAHGHTQYAASAHNHTAPDINSGTLANARLPRCPIPDAPTGLLTLLAVGAFLTDLVDALRDSSNGICSS